MSRFKSSYYVEAIKIMLQSPNIKVLIASDIIDTQLSKLKEILNNLNMNYSIKNKTITLRNGSSITIEGGRDLKGNIPNIILFDGDLLDEEDLI